ADDEIVAEDQPYAGDASPIAQSPEYVSESDFEAHPEDDDDEDPEEDPLGFLFQLQYLFQHGLIQRPAGGFRVDYGFVATVDREIMRNPEREVGYRITDSWDEIVETLQGAPV
nr:hypothetical protein [Tanacetum cinerariifolium]